MPRPRNSALTELLEEIRRDGERAPRRRSSAAVWDEIFSEGPSQSLRAERKPPRKRKGSARRGEVDLLNKLDHMADKVEPHEIAEVRRIVDVPLIHKPTKKEIDLISQREVLSKSYEAGFRLMWTQAAALETWRRHRGLFGPIGVGHGKTLITLLCANLSWEQGVKKILLIPYVGVYQQFVQDDIPWAIRHVPFSVPLHLMGGKPSATRRRMAKSKRKGCYVLPDSMLSTKDGELVLRQINPDVLIVDEAHSLRNRSSARTKRILRFLESRQQEGNPVQCAFLSGTMTTKGVMDYWHLARASLGEKCFLPMTLNLAKDWSKVLDSSADEYNEKPGQLGPVIDWSRQHFPKETITQDLAGFRKAYRNRLKSTPGVVATGDEDIGVSLIIENRPVEGYEQAEGYEQIKELDRLVVEEATTPNGDEIEHAIHGWKWRYELSSGFYNELIWPTVGRLRKRKGWSQKRSKEMLAAAKSHHEAAQEFSRGLRNFLTYQHRRGMDSPLLIRNELFRNKDKNLPTALFKLWVEARDLEVPDMPERYERAVRVCDFKVKHAVSWAKRTQKAGHGGIIWCRHKEIARWTRDLLKEAEVDFAYCPAGKRYNELIKSQETAGKIVVASMIAHGQGKNLQHFQHQIFLQWPRSSKTAEQTLGRMHRNGQKADVLVAYTCNTLDFDHVNFAACMNDALYQQQTLGSRQRMIYARYSPAPKIFLPSVLREQGADVKRLSKKDVLSLQDRFGSWSSVKR